MGPRFVFLMMAAVLILSACGSQPTFKFENLARSQPTSALLSFVSVPTWFSFDGTTGSGWSPQAPLPQWIQVDLGSPATVNKVRLLVNQDVRGRRVHALWVGETLDDLKQVQCFDQVTSSGN